MGPSTLALPGRMAGREFEAEGWVASGWICARPWRSVQDGSAGWRGRVGVEGRLVCLARRIVGAGATDGGHLPSRESSGRHRQSRGSYCMWRRHRQGGSRRWNSRKIGNGRRRSRWAVSNGRLNRGTSGECGLACWAIMGGLKRGALGAPAAHHRQLAASAVGCQSRVGNQLRQSRRRG